MPYDLSSTKLGAALARLRADANATQSTVAEIANIDQSRISRLEKGEIEAREEIFPILKALEQLGSNDATPFQEYLKCKWDHVEPPSFWNPQRASLEIAEEVLGKIDAFLADSTRPWPLRRQIEKHKENLLQASTFLSRLQHNIAFIGDIGVGKSTAISFIFDLLVPASVEGKPSNRPILETGAGGTTVCEVHIKSGPEFGVSIIPMGDSELQDIVSDFCAALWSSAKRDPDDQNERAAVSREVDRAIRNMSGLVRKRQTVEGKIVRQDPALNLAQECQTEEEYRANVIGLMEISDRTTREVWYDSSTRKGPMEWIRNVFVEINNGRRKDVSLPQCIDLIVPEFGKAFCELDITLIDTKGVDDVAVRPDLDLRLKDSRTAVVLCSRFNDAPGTSAKALMQHMRETFSAPLDSGKISLLILPRAEEATAMKDDTGEQALTDQEGYEFKQSQVENVLCADDMSGVPAVFYNVFNDDARTVRQRLFDQINRIREEVSNRLYDLCAAADEIIENHEAHALNAAIEEVANRLNSFLQGNRRLGARERHAYEEALITVKGVRYASTLWAATRRNGEYSGLNFVHQIGVGAARDAQLRCTSWFNALEGQIRALQADDELKLASKAISQIETSANASRRTFLEHAQRLAMEIYRDPLTQASVWNNCASEWGQGPGFKNRVADHLEEWFNKKVKLKERLDDALGKLWEREVIAPLVALSEEAPSEGSKSPDDESSV